MSSGTCTAFVTATNIDIIETTMSCTSGVNDNYCGTLESKSARYIGCFDLYPVTTDFYMDSSCTTKYSMG